MRLPKKKKKEILFENKPETITPISSNIDDNISQIKENFKDSNDVIFREFNIGGPNGTKMFLSYIDGMADRNLLNEFVLTPIMVSVRETKPSFEEIKERLYEATKSSAMAATDFKEVETVEETLVAIMAGDTPVFMNGYTKAFILGTRLWPARSPSEPVAETVIRGPRDGFTETIRFNTALVRRRIRDTRFKVKQTQIGTRSKTDIAILYIEDIVDKKLLEDVEKKIKNIVSDSIIDSGYLEQFLDDRHFTPFPQIQATERPDVMAGGIYEGRVGILVDNSPFGLILPATFTAFFQSAEDYYSRSSIVTFVRLIRLMSGLISLVAPSLYIALTSYNPGIIPSKLVLSIAASREGVPFPAFIEALIMEITLEFLREAGVRLPRPIGSTIGIVGGIVIGQAAVQAGIVSPIMVIVVAVTAICSFAIPNYEIAAGFRLIRFLLMITAAIYGLYGVILGSIGVLIHLVNIKSFGTPYMSPMAPLETSDLKDSIFLKLPWTFMNKRPEHLSPQDLMRQEGDENDTE